MENDKKLLLEIDKVIRCLSIDARNCYIMDYKCLKDLQNTLMELSILIKNTDEPLKYYDIGDIDHLRTLVQATGIITHSVEKLCLNNNNVMLEKLNVLLFERIARVATDFRDSTEKWIIQNENKKYIKGEI